MAFVSTASNLLPGTNVASTGTWNVYRRDRTTNTTIRVSSSLTGGYGDGHSFAPAMSSDGRFIAFASQAHNLIASDLNDCTDIYLRDVQAGTTTRVSVGPGGLEPIGDSTFPCISSDGRFIAFQSAAANITSQPAPNGVPYVCLHDRMTGSTARVVTATWTSLAAGGTTNPALSPDGRWIAFSSTESDLAAGDENDSEDVFVRGPLF